MTLELYMAMTGEEDPWRVKRLGELVESAVAAERARCAAIAKAEREWCESLSYDEYGKDAAMRIETRIREGGAP